MRDSIRCYANGWYSAEWAPGNNWRPITPEEHGQLAKEVVALGYDALKFNPFGAPPGTDWPDNERILDPRRADLGFARVAAVRDAVGPDVDIMVEVHGWLGPTSAIEMGRRLVELKPFFYEEPVDAMNVECMRKVSENVPIPLAAGERLYTRYQFREYIEKQVVDILQPDVGLAGRHHRAEKDRRLRRDLRSARAAAQLPRAHCHGGGGATRRLHEQFRHSGVGAPSVTRSPTIWSTSRPRWRWSMAICLSPIGRAWA